MSKNMFFAFGMIALALAVTAMPDQAHAFAAMRNAVCRVAQAVQSDIGRAIAILAVLIAGLGAFFGKANWGLVVMIAVGIAAVMGAGSIVALVSNGSSTTDVASCSGQGVN